MAYVEASAGALFSIFFAIFSTGFVLQFREFMGAGLSPESLLASMGLLSTSEDVRFLEYHLVKTVGKQQQQEMSQEDLNAIFF